MVQLTTAKNGEFTICDEKNGKKFYLHSQYNPGREAFELVERWNIPNDRDIVVYGLGCGHHLRHVLNKLGDNHSLEIVECRKEIVDLARNQPILYEILSDQRVQLNVFGNEQDMIHFLLDSLQSVQTGNGSFYIHGPSLKAIPDRFTSVMQLLEEYQVQTATIQAQKTIVQKNLQTLWPLLHQYPSIIRAKDSFTDIPAVIVAAGPSLYEALPVLRSLQNKALLICVGTAYSTLRKNGIRPDFIVVTEPNAAVLSQFDCMDETIPLITFPTSCPQLVMGYKGPIIWAFQDAVEELREEAKKNNLETIETGSSVATAALSIATFFGCNPIVFVGQDLAYVNGRTHAKGTVYEHQQISSQAFLRETDAIGGGKIETSLSWDLFRKWIEGYIAEHSNVQYYNASKGARIFGTTECSLESLVDDGVFNNTYLLEKMIHTIFKIFDWRFRHEKPETNCSGD